MSTLSEDERQELSLLLPFYANGTLGDEDNRRVEAALAKDEDLSREYDLVLEDQAAVVDQVSEEEVPVSIGERFKAALNAEIEAPSVAATPDQAQESLFSRIASVLFSERPRAYAAIAAVVILLIPALVILSGDGRQQGTGQYQTASGEDDPASDAVRLLVKVQPGVSWTDIDAFLKENQGQITRGPTADGLYELQFEPSDEIVEKMNGEARLFEFVIPSN